MLVSISYPISKVSHHLYTSCFVIFKNCTDCSNFLWLQLVTMHEGEPQSARRYGGNVTQPHMHTFMHDCHQDTRTIVTIS